MNDEQIGEIWTLFKEYIDKKQVDIIAEKFVDLLADYGVGDHVLKDALGVDADLDAAIGYYLEIDADVSDDEDWDE